MSVLPISFFTYFSTHRSINSDVFVHRILTYSTSLDFLRCDPKNGDHLDHYLNDYIHHFRGRLDFCVDLETSEKHLNFFEDVNKCVLACSNIFRRLRGVRVTMARTKL